MRITRTLVSALAVALVAGACATNTMLPVTDVPSGNYVLVEPSGGTYTAIAINERAHTLRMGNTITTGQQWVDADGQLHMVPDEGTCAGMESVWTYSYSGNRLTLDRVSNACTSMEMPTHLVFERH